MAQPLVIKSKFWEFWTIFQGLAGVFPTGRQNRDYRMAVSGAKPSRANRFCFDCKHILKSWRSIFPLKCYPLVLFLLFSRLPPPSLLSVWVTLPSGQLLPQWAPVMYLLEFPCQPHPAADGKRDPSQTLRGPLSVFCASRDPAPRRPALRETMFGISSSSLSPRGLDVERHLWERWREWEERNSYPTDMQKYCVKLRLGWSLSREISKAWFFKLWAQLGGHSTGSSV